MPNIKKLTKEKLEKDYYTDKKTCSEIARKYKTYPNKILRMAKQFGIELRTPSETQQHLLESGAVKHPTEGTTRSQKTKEKIGDSQSAVWENLNDEDREVRAQIGRESYDLLTDKEKREMHEKAHKGLMIAAREGSRLEKYILNGLISHGYRVEYHKQHLLAHELLELDLFLPVEGIAIEIDGISHFEPIWGEEKLEKQKIADMKKGNLLMSQGKILIRIKQKGSISPTYMRKVLRATVKCLEEIKDMFPKRPRKHIKIEV
jgi:hypothetical protein